MTLKKENPAANGAASISLDKNNDTGEIQEEQGISSIMQEIEQYFLGAIIASDEAFNKARTLEPSNFSFPVHGEIYASIARRYKGKKLVRAQLLAMEFSTHPELSHLGGGRYIIDIANNIISTVAAPEYAEQIGELVKDSFIACIVFGLAFMSWATQQSAPFLHVKGNSSYMPASVRMGGRSSKQGNSFIIFVVLLLLFFHAL